jgi:hypothetical protein
VFTLVQPIGSLNAITVDTDGPLPITAAEVRMMMSWARDLLLAR